METVDQIASEVIENINRTLEYGMDDIERSNAINEVRAAVEKALGGQKAELDDLRRKWNWSSKELELRAAQGSEPPFNPDKHHPSCTPNDQTLIWVCAQCGHNEPFRQ